VSSERIRGAADAEALKDAGSAIAIYELQGDLILASVEQLVRRIYEQDQPARIVILDLRRVWRVGDAAAMLVARAIAAQEALGHRLVMAGVDPASEYGDRLIAAGVGAEAFAGTLDAALEWAENQVLEEAGPIGGGNAMAAADMDIFAGLSAAQLAAVTARLETQRFAAGDIVFPEGAEADCVYFLAAGQASIVLNLPDGTERRLAGISAGACFGEMAAFDGEPRSADVRADSDITCLALPTGALRELARHDPALYAAIMENLVRMLVARLRRADAQLKALR
jgi:anti-anti-sigma regulatory factor